METMSYRPVVPLLTGELLEPVSYIRETDDQKADTATDVRYVSII